MGDTLRPAFEAQGRVPSLTSRSMTPLFGGLSVLDKLREAASDAPVIRFVNALLSRAVDERASDIHMEPSTDGLTVRFRVDGRLRAREAPPSTLRDAVISRVKTDGRARHRRTSAAAGWAHFARGEGRGGRFSRCDRSHRPWREPGDPRTYLRSPSTAVGSGHRSDCLVAGP
jgi:hypothetical protein